MSNIDFEDDDLSKYEIDDLDIEEDEVPKKDVNVKRNPKGKGGAPKGAKPSPKGVPSKGASPKGKITKKKNEKDKNVVYAVAVAGGLMLAVSGYLIFNSISTKKAAAKQAELLAQQQEIAEQQQQQYNQNSSEVSAGIPSLYGNGSGTNNSALTSSNEILKDLNGNTVDPNYKVVANNTVTDFINYKKYRATTGNGLEFYWLEAKYKGGDYKVQVPYSIYSKLDSEGITVVDAEVLTLDNGSEIVTYMSVRKDAKDLLDKNR